MDFDKSQKSCLSGIYIFDQHYKSRAEQRRRVISSQGGLDKDRCASKTYEVYFTYSFFVKDQEVYFSHIRFLWKNQEVYLTYSFFVKRSSTPAVVVIGSISSSSPPLAAILRK